MKSQFKLTTILLVVRTNPRRAARRAPRAAAGAGQAERAKAAVE